MKSGKTDIHKTDNDTECPESVKLYDIHPDIRQSAFLEEVASNSDDELLCDAKLVANMLYKKYIEVGSELEINIAAGLRKRLRDTLSDKDKLMKNNNINLNELLLLFEKPKDEMKSLLNFSHTRFKGKAEYAKIVEILSEPSSQFRRLSISISKNL